MRCAFENFSSNIRLDTHNTQTNHLNEPSIRRNFQAVRDRSQDPGRCYRSMGQPHSVLTGYNLNSDAETKNSSAVDLRHGENTCWMDFSGRAIKFRPKSGPTTLDWRSRGLPVTSTISGKYVKDWWENSAMRFEGDCIHKRLKIRYKNLEPWEVYGHILASLERNPC